MTSTLVLLRHGQSEWNLANRFTGWWDVDLTPLGEAEARAAGPTLAAAGVLPDILHTSVLTRAIRTAQLALAPVNRLWIPVRRHWRLNERHYGDLTGLDKKRTREIHGEAQLHAWRRGYATPPPPMTPGHEFDPSTDPRYAMLAPEVIPRTECLRDVVERMLPYWYDAIVPDLRTGAVVLVAAHGNSLRALVKHLDHISDDDIADVNIPTGIPLRYELGDDMMPAEDVPLDSRYLGDPEAVRAAAEAVANQAR